MKSHFAFCALDGHWKTSDARCKHHENKDIWHKDLLATTLHRDRAEGDSSPIWPFLLEIKEKRKKKRGRSKVVSPAFPPHSGPSLAKRGGGGG